MTIDGVRGFAATPSRMLALLTIAAAALVVAREAVPQNPKAAKAANASSKPASKEQAAEKDSTTESEEEQKTAWQYDPYRIRVWVAFDFNGALSPSLLAAIRQRVLDGAEAAAFSTWTVEVEPVPDQLLRADMVVRMDDITSNQLFALAGMSTVKLLEPGKAPPRRQSTKEADEELEQEKFAVSPLATQLRDTINNHDKIMLVAVKASPLGYEVICREVDTVTRNVGLPHHRLTRQRGMIPDHVFGAISNAFRPIVRIQSVSANGKEADGMVRAGGLIEGPGSPSHVDVNDALLPIVRNNDRLGQPKEFNGIRATEWSYLHVTERDKENVKLQLHSALRGPLGGRGGSRVQRFGLKVRPRFKTTKVRLISKPGGRPLSGYEIYSRHVTDKEDSVEIGLTNWNGEIDVGQHGDFPLRLLYIKNGGSLLAGIPLLPGHHEFLQAEMRDDETRLQAEAFVRSIQNTILDTVAQRQMISTRIDKALKDGDRDAAIEQLENYRRLSTLNFVLDLLNRRKKDMITADRRMQMQIDLMFQDTQDLAVEYLDDEKEGELNRRVNPTGAAPPAPIAPPAAPNTTPAQKSPAPATPAENPNG